MTMTVNRALVWGWAACGLACQGGGDGDDAGPPACVEFDAAACTPQFPAEFDRLFDEVLLPICGVQGGACHGNADAAGAPGGLVLDTDRDASHTRLVQAREPGPFVVAGDVACSPLAVRVNTDDPLYLMPPGESGLSPGQACALAQWIDAGAMR